MSENTYQITLTSPAIVSDDGPIRRIGVNGVCLSATALKYAMRNHLSTLNRDDTASADIIKEIFGYLEPTGHGRRALFDISHAITNDRAEIISVSYVSVNRTTPNVSELRTRETVPAGTTFLGKLYTNVASNSQADTAIRFALLGVQRIGKGQNLGYGRCSLTLADNSIVKENIYRIDEYPFKRDILAKETEIRICDIDAEFLRCIQREPDRLRSLSPRQFEQFIAALFRNAGFEVELTPETRDGGYDVLAVKHNLITGPEKFLVECKRYAEGKPVGIQVVRSLMGVIDMKNATKGIIVTTSSFSRDPS